MRYKKSALVGKEGHSSSQQHEMAIEREHKRVSYFHKEFETNQQSRDSVCTMPFSQHIGWQRKKLPIGSSHPC